jgi:serine protease Do
MALAMALAVPALGDAPAAGTRVCSGDYADDLSVLSARARDYELQQQPYTYCIRTTAVYECPSYGPDGALRKARRKVVAHGTGFAYRQQGNETLLVTNEHVAEWPIVTDDEHNVQDVPAGCKRVSDTLKIVDNESDSYERDDISLARVVVDPQLDVAVLRARAPLAIMPWKVGKSALLRERNVVDVRGFPLGVLRANNVGKVISAYDHDDAFDWDHDDFVVDALLSPGNSGSPVFAVSCRTGEFELVGIYHAGYTHGSALNEVIAIDQVRDLMTTLKRPARARRGDVPTTLDGEARARLVAHVRASADPYFAFGNATASVRLREDGALLFEVMSPEFPLRTVPALAVEDLPTPERTSFGTLGRVWAGNRQGLRQVSRSSLDAEVQSQLGKALDGLRHDALLAFSYREAARAGIGSRERFDHVSKLEHSARRSAAARSYLVQNVLELAGNWCPDNDEASLGVAELMRPPPPGNAEPVVLLPPAAPVPAAAPGPAQGTAHVPPQSQAPAAPVPPAGMAR